MLLDFFPRTAALCALSWAIFLRSLRELPTDWDLCPGRRHRANLADKDLSPGTPGSRPCPGLFSCAPYGSFRLIGIWGQDCVAAPTRRRGPFAGDPRFAPCPGLFSCVPYGSLIAMRLCQISRGRVQNVG